MKKIHHILGLYLCLTTLIICITGTLLVWKKEYLWLTVPQARQDLDRSPTAIAGVLEAIQQNYQPEELSFVQLFSENLGLHKVYLSNKRYAWHDQQGQQLEVWSANDRIEDWLLDLHHRFLLGNTIGLNIAGFTALFLVLQVLLGLRIWWPRRRTLKMGLRPKTKWHGSYLVSHGNIASVSTAPILMLVISGIILVYPDEARKVLVAPFKTSTAHQRINMAAKETEKNDSGWLYFLNESLTQFPNAQFRWISFSTNDHPEFVVGLQQAEGWNRTGKSSVAFNPNTLRITKKHDALAQATAQRVFEFSYPLHTGKIGLWYKILLTLFGLALLSVILLGLTSYQKRKMD